MASLYEIDASIKALLDSIIDMADEDGDVGEIDFSQLEELNQARTAKLENIALYIKNLTAEAEAIKAEEEKLKTRRKRLENKTERLKGLMIQSMKDHNEPKIATARYSASIRDNEQTEIVDIEQIPKEYIKVKTKTSADKTAIKKAIKAGQEIAGARIVINTTIKIE